jgi:hypothetical protein
VLAPANGGATFWCAVVNKTASSAVLTVYHGVDNTGEVIAVIDASTAIGSLWYGVYCPNGIYYALTGGNADITLGCS